MNNPTAPNAPNSPTPTICINNYLPDDCLRLIFEYLTIPEQLRLSPVCTRWHALLRTICHSKQSLKLFSSPFHLHQHAGSISKYELTDKPDFAIAPSPGPDDEILILPAHKPASTFLSLPELFPNISRLLIFDVQQLYQGDFTLLTYLKRWPRLRHLSLFRVPEPSRLSPGFWSTFSGLPELETLNLGKLNGTVIPEDLPFLGQISFFSLIFYRANIEPILRQLGPGLRVLNLSMVNLDAEALERIITQNPDFGSNLRILGLDYITTTAGSACSRTANYRSLLSLICRSFKRLTFLDILFGDDVPLLELAHNLSLLPNLSKLRAHLRHDHLPSSYSLKSLPRLPAISELYLELNSITSNQFIPLMSSLFPSLTVLTVKCDSTMSNLDEFRSEIMGAFPKIETIKLIRI